MKAVEEDKIKGPEDLKGRTVAVILGSNLEQLLNELPYADEINVKSYESNIALDTSLCRVYSFVMDRVSLVQLIAKSPLPLALARKPVEEIRNAMPFRNDDVGCTMRNRVDTALSALRENSMLALILGSLLAIERVIRVPMLELLGATQMDGGRIVEQGPPQQLLDALQNPRTKEFLRRVS